CLHRRRILPGLGGLERHQHHARVFHRAGLLLCLARLQRPRRGSLVHLAGGGAGVFRARLPRAARHSQSGDRRAGAGHAHADLRPGSHPQQCHDPGLHRRLPQAHPRSAPGRAAGRWGGDPLGSAGGLVAGAGAYRRALHHSAALAGGSRHRRRAAGSRCRAFDGRQRQIDLRDCVWAGGGDGRMCWGPAGDDIPDFPVDLHRVSGQGVCRLRAGWPGQCARRGRRRNLPRHRGECRGAGFRARTWDHAVVRPPDPVPDFPSQWPAGQKGVRMKTRVFIGVLVAMLVMAALPLLDSAYALRLGTTASMYAIMAVSSTVIGGCAAYPSVGTGAFCVLVAYQGGILVAAGQPLAVAVLAAGLLAFTGALLLGVVLLRLRGHYFAIASLAVGEVLRELTNAATDLTGGGMGLNVPLTMSGGGIMGLASYFYWCMLGLLVATFVIVHLIERSKLGFGLVCIRQNEAAADMIGVNGTVYKSLAFGV